MKHIALAPAEASIVDMLHHTTKSTEYKVFAPNLSQKRLCNYDQYKKSNTGHDTVCTE